MIILASILYVLCIALAVYAFFKDRQFQKERQMADYGRSVLMAKIINNTLREKIAEAKGITLEEFNRSWRSK